MTNKAKRVAIIDDDRDFSLSLVELLQVEGYEVSVFNDARLAIKQIGATYDGAVLLDIRMPEISGQEVLHQLLEKDHALPVIHITGHGDIPMAVHAVKQGAYGFFTKPLQVDDLLREIDHAIAARYTELERRSLAHQLAVRDDLSATVIGASPQIQQLRQQILKVGKSDVDVMVHGETGAGKELVARALVNYSTRADAPFVAVNCGHVSHQQAPEEFFGIETLLPSGETNIRPGYFERANSGTLLLDEIESMPAEMQSRLLRVLQERTLERINGTAPVLLNLRIITTTKADLQAMVSAGNLREDLYYRLSGAALHVPPLRERGTDPVMLFMKFLSEHGVSEEIAPGLMSDLLSHDWPGNVRELRNAANRFVSGLSVFSETDHQRKDSLAARVASFEKGLIEASLTQNQGSLKRTMLDLDVPRKTLYDKMSKHGIHKEHFISDE